MTDDMRARVAAGVAALDANGPAEWWNKIDLETLDISSACHCVMGQLVQVLDRPMWGDVLPGSEDSQQAMAWGMLTGYATPLSYQEENDHLTEEWKRIILKRRQDHAH